MVSNALTVWSEKGDDYEGVTYGLWRYCPSTPDGKTCEDLSCPSEIFETGFCNKILAARTFLTLACILSCTSGIIWVLFCAVTVDTTPRLLLLVDKGLTFGCLLAGIIGVAVGISATMNAESEMKLRLGAAAIVGIVGIVTNIVGALLSVLVKQ
ncbi:unnamed protein product [Rotaria sp. Silwood1]|nr:unnamed protein product [Rotaria sp. Silwood1]CAF1645712.1 unnamed protein product [Rotaria sp. Silwood1]